ncbi:MAG: hypothetical protein ACXVB9_00800 [Bdellovibrionota bacterium]
MKKVILTTLFAVWGNSAAASSDFTGHWKGEGTYQSEAILKAVPAKFEITMNETASQLSIVECWSYVDALEGPKSDCYKSDYSVDESAAVFSNGKKIGDIFPGRTSIFQGNSQVSELMTFDLNEKRDLLFRYSSSNMDGGMNIQFAELAEVK